MEPRITPVAARDIHGLSLSDLNPGPTHRGRQRDALDLVAPGPIAHPRDLAPYPRLRILQRTAGWLCGQPALLRELPGLPWDRHRRRRRRHSRTPSRSLYAGSGLPAHRRAHGPGTDAVGLRARRPRGCDAQPGGHDRRARRGQHPALGQHRSRSRLSEAHVRRDLQRHTRTRDLALPMGRAGCAGCERDLLRGWKWRQRQRPVDGRLHLSRPALAVVDRRSRRPGAGHRSPASRPELPEPAASRSHVLAALHSRIDRPTSSCASSTPAAGSLPCRWNAT